MDVSEAKRLDALEEENAKLKKLLAEQMLDAAALRELLSKNDRARRQTRRGGASGGQDGAVGAAGLFDRGSGSEDDPLPLSPATGRGSLRARLRELANERRRFGYRRLFVPLRWEGEPSGINRIQRLYREEGLVV
jgi:hypothetical protein